MINNSHDFNSTDRGFEALKNNVINAGLCTHCGTCVAVCPVNNIEINDIYGVCLPRSKGVCNNCGVCIKTCPGKNMSIPDIRSRIFNKNNPDKDVISEWQSLYVAHATDADVRQKGSSGGVVTTILLNSLRKKEIIKAIVCGTNYKGSWQPETMLIGDAVEVTKAAGSKYFHIPTNCMLQNIKDLNGPVAYVGLPCQVHGLRKIEKEIPSMTKNIVYVIGLQCGKAESFRMTLDLITKLGVKDLNGISKVGYREGRFPGKFEITTKNGITKSIKKSDYLSISHFYEPERCRLCLDHSNRFADISVGDADPWMPQSDFWKDGGLGRSLVVVRTDAGRDLINMAIRDKAIVVADLLPEYKQKYSNHLERQKQNTIVRLAYHKKLKQPFPDYGIDLPIISTKKLLVAHLKNILWEIAFGKMSYSLFLRMPIKIYTRILGLPLRIRRWVLGNYD